MARQLTVLHFNDVYHLGAFSTPTGGCRSDRLARFWHRMQDFVQERPLVCFGGDFLAPSLESAFTKGQHMMEAMEHLGVHVGMPGNHDFDFGAERARELFCDPVLFGGTAKARSSWVLTNITAPDGAPLAGVQRHVLIEHGGVKVGLLGLAENWLSEAGLNADTARWQPEVEAGRAAARELRERGAELVLGLMHSNVVTMTPVADALREDVDFFMGGHEHVVAPGEWHAGRHNWIISGWEFEEFSILRFQVPEAGQRVGPPTLQRVPVPADAALPEQDTKLQELRAFVAGYDSLVQQRLKEPVGRCDVELDMRKFMLRTQETAGGNLFADLCLRAMLPHGAQVGFLISGALSSHRLWPPGDLSMETVVSVFPWEGVFVLLEVLGRDLLQALEHGVSLLPRRFGRFPQVAGMSFAVDAGEAAGRRISDVVVNGQPLIDDQPYLVATTDYIAQGGDDYEVFVKKGVLKVSDEFGPGIHDACRRVLPDMPSPRVEGRIRHRRAFRMSMEPEELAVVGAEVDVKAW